ncbi:hypothetical protein ABIB14_001682 [Arthrobacter sp. UYEF3]
MAKPGLMRRLPQIAHVDVNCLYVSAERAFTPALEGRPVIVRSNNGGCAVTRSPEAKALTIAMGEAWFKLAPAPRSGPRRPLQASSMDQRDWLWWTPDGGNMILWMLKHLRPRN